MFRRRRGARCLAMMLFGLVFPRLALAQPVERVGARALGLGGAFVAVADDASAVYWNPAGLAGGGFLGLTVDLQWLAAPRGGAADERFGPVSAGGWLLAVVTPPLGLSYYRLGSHGRDVRSDDTPAGATRTARLDTSHLGVTLLQSIGDHATVGATVKYVQGRAAAGVSFSTTSAGIRDDAAEGDEVTGSRLDVDLGVHVQSGGARFGVLVRNLTEPTFPVRASGVAPLGLSRQVRLGLALMPSTSWLVTADADLLRAESFDGTWRRGALGVERWLWARQFALRGGTRFNTHGPRHPVLAFGAGLALRSGLYVDAHIAAGHVESEEAFGVAARVVF